MGPDNQKFEILQTFSEIKLKLLDYSRLSVIPFYSIKNSEFLVRMALSYSKNADVEFPKLIKKVILLFKEMVDSINTEMSNPSENIGTHLQNTPLTNYIDKDFIPGIINRGEEEDREMDIFQNLNFEKVK